MDANLAFHLTETERKILTVLSRQPGRIYTRQELIAEIMPGVKVLPRTIDVHIRHLREKLGPAGERVRTIRKQGYVYQHSGKG